mmetsp:Transcript_14983/g.15000  ORF Transcript_14983/g.15000 Transcript_14983/m.15000 type:complete len:80 (+) Transcript_14983:24-263(+)
MEDQLQAQMQNHMLALMLQGLLKGCFDKCIAKPSDDLTANEKQCLAMCQDRYQEAFQKTFVRQLERLAKLQEPHTDFPN